MAERGAPDPLPPTGSRVLGRPDLLAGAMFMAVALLGLYLSRGYDMGTAARMGTGYVPRLVCWILLALGGFIAFRGFHAEHEIEDPVGWRALVAIPAAIVAFGMLVEQAGLVVASAALLLIGAFAARGVRPLETLGLGLALIAGSALVFVWALGLPMAIWPEF